MSPQLTTDPKPLPTNSRRLRDVNSFNWAAAGLSFDIQQLVSAISHHSIIHHPSKPQTHSLGEISCCEPSLSAVALPTKTTSSNVGLPYSYNKEVPRLGELFFFRLPGSFLPTLAESVTDWLRTEGDSRHLLTCRDHNHNHKIVKIVMSG